MLRAMPANGRRPPPPPLPLPKSPLICAAFTAHSQSGEITSACERYLNFLLILDSFVSIALLVVAKVVSNLLSLFFLCVAISKDCLYIIFVFLFSYFKKILAFIYHIFSRHLEGLAIFVFLLWLLVSRC